MTAPLGHGQIEEEEDAFLRTKREEGGTPSLNPSLESSIASLRGGGRPLSKPERSFFEPRFGYDFSQVRVHNGSAAEQSARNVDAKAYTMGHDIVFGAGWFGPGTQAGQRLLAHELTHVVQQSGGDEISPGLSFGKGDQSAGGQQAVGIAYEGGKQITIRHVTASTSTLQRDWREDLADHIAHDLNDYVAKNPSPYKHVIETVHFEEKNEIDDDIAANFVELQSLANIEKFAATPEGRAMLDVLYEAMTTGHVTAFERLQADRILFAKWKWVPTEVYEIAQLRDLAMETPEEIVVDRKASKIAKDLRDDAAKNLYSDVIKKVKQLDPYIEDNVASHFIVLQSPDQLEKFAADHQGRAMLDVLYEALITGDVSDFERLQTERILTAKARRIPPISPKQYLSQLEQEKQYILPLRMQKTFRASYAIFEAKLQPNGKVEVRYDDEIAFWDADMFKEDFKNLPPEHEAKHGFELNPDQLVWLKLYDQDKKLVAVPALALIDYANQAMRQSASVGIRAFQMGLFLGLGLGALSGAGVMELAAELEAGRASVTALRMAKGLLWADRVAILLPTVSWVVNENREWILDKFPNAGPVLLRVLDQANRITEYYGWARMGVDGARFIKSELGPALTEWRAERKALKGEISRSKQDVVTGIDDEIDLILKEADKAETEAGLAAVKFVEEHPNVIEGKPGERRAKVGDHKVIEVKDPITGATHCELRSGPVIEIPCPKQYSQEPQVEPSKPAEPAKTGEPAKPSAEAAEAEREAAEQAERKLQQQEAETAPAKRKQEAEAKRKQEEQAAAAKKKQKEEAAAKRKQQREEAEAKRKRDEDEAAARKKMDEADAEIRRAREKELQDQYSANEKTIKDIDKEIQKHDQRRREYYDEADKFVREAKPNFKEKADNKIRQAQNETRLRDEWQVKRIELKSQNEMLVKQIQAGKIGPRPSQPRGGAYRDVPTAGGEVNHIPPVSVLPKRLSKYDGPAIWMEKADHMKTNSWGSGAIKPTDKYPYKTAEQWRAAQSELIKKGKFREAMRMDIDDIAAKFGNKYERGIREMMEYANKLNL